MTSILRKISGLEVVDVPDPPPIDNTVPVFPPNPPNINPIIPSPIIPNWSPNTFKPLKDESIPRPKPDGNAKVSVDDDWVVVYYPPDPNIPGDTEKWLRYKKSDYDYLVSIGVLP